MQQIHPIISKGVPANFNESTNVNEVTNLLWTGGWDSTFRLLDLVLIQKQTVQPYYIKSTIRKSSELEVQTMDKIRRMLFELAPQSKLLLLPTIYKNVNDISPNEVLTQQYKRLSAAKHLGTQYDFLARFATEAGINDLELSIHKDDHAQKFLHPYVEETDHDGIYRLQQNPAYEDLKLFQNFRFPILELTKLDMQETAAKYNFLDLMNETVFCHTPQKNGKPCGYCNPCRYTMEEGLSRRIPLLPRLKYFTKRALRPFVKPLLQLIKK